MVRDHFTAEKMMPTLAALIILAVVVKPDNKRNKVRFPSGMESESIRPQPNDWLFRQRAYPSGSVDHKAYFKALKFREEKSTLIKSLGNGRNQWQFCGPTNIGG